MAKPWIYVDTSAFLKLIIRESGTERMRRLVKEHRLLSSSVIAVECRSAVARRRREGKLIGSELDRALARIEEGLEAVEMVLVSDPVLELAGAIVLRSVSRTMDALHIASAFSFQDDAGMDVTFVTADRKQHQAARGEGLATLLLA